MKPRRGTKGNPFKFGEKVRRRSWYAAEDEEGEVVEVTNTWVVDSLIGERSWTPIRYLVDFGHTKEWLEARYLETMEELWSMREE
jgi:hypothetical protein